MRYPILANWISFKRASEDEYIVEDLLYNKQFNMDSYTVWFVRQLNGKRNPYRIDSSLSRKDVYQLLTELEAKNVIRDNRFFSKFFLYLLITIWRPRDTPALRLVSFFANIVLLISWFPLLSFSIYYFLNNLYVLNTEYITIGSFVGLFVGVLMHELAHMWACLCYGGKVFETGFMLQFFLPGAYVLLNHSNVKKRMRRIQISAAGVEMNWLLTGLFLILSVKFELLSGFFLGAAINNAIMALLNLTLVNGFDGMAIMSELLGIEELANKAKRITKSKLYKRKLSGNGVAGKATIIACYIVRFIQVALPLVFTINIVGVVSWFL